jgi:hypothetical protein
MTCGDPGPAINGGALVGAWRQSLDLTLGLERLHRGPSPVAVTGYVTGFATGPGRRSSRSPVQLRST